MVAKSTFPCPAWAGGQIHVALWLYLLFYFCVIFSWTGHLRAYQILLSYIYNMLTFPKGSPLFLPSFIPSIQQRPHKVPLTNVVSIFRRNVKPNGWCRCYTICFENHHLHCNCNNHQLSSGRFLNRTSSPSCQRETPLRRPLEPGDRF